MAASDRAVHQESPLIQIQQAEASAAQQLEAAREAAHLAVHRARLEADQRKRDAADEGRRAGEALRAQVAAEAGAEAEQLLAEAHDRNERINSNDQQIVAQMARHAVVVVLGEQEAAGI